MIEKLIPHRGTMLLIDEILELRQDFILATKKIRGDEFFLDGHYPDFPIVPGVITCECLFQTGAALISNILKNEPNRPTGIPVIARIRLAKFTKPILPGDLMYLSCTLKERLSTVFQLSGEARVGEEKRATVEFTTTLAEGL